MSRIQDTPDGRARPAAGAAVRLRISHEADLDLPVRRLARTRFPQHAAMTCRM